MTFSLPPHKIWPVSQLSLFAGFKKKFLIFNGPTGNGTTG